MTSTAATQALEAPAIAADAFVARRQRLAQALGDGETLVVATHPETTYSNDVHHRFRPQSDFWYLTGFTEPESVLVLQGGTGRSDLFLRSRKPAAEIWNGRRLGIERAAETLGVDRAHGIEALGAFVRELDGHVAAIVDHEPAIAEVLANNAPGHAGGSDAVTKARTIKDAQEIAMLQKAADVASEAHRRCFAAVAAGRYEYEVEAELLHGFRSAGSTGPGYPPIVGSGANAAVLHYVDNDARIGAGDLVLIDAGCEWGYYNSDITRTVPADGAFTADQARWYDIVHDAQVAAIGAAKPGETLMGVHDAACRVIAEGLADAGWIQGNVDKAMDAEEHRAYYMHGTSHFLGLDVHDVGAYKEEDGGSRILKPGMAITVEPGIYANPDFAKLPEGVDPFGIRLENDLVITDDGNLDLTASLPAERGAFEDLLLQIRGA